MSYSVALQRFHQLQDEAEESFSRRLFDQGMDQWELAYEEISDHLHDNESLDDLRKSFARSLLAKGLGKAASMIDGDVDLQSPDHEADSDNDSGCEFITKSSVRKAGYTKPIQRNVSPDPYVQEWDKLRLHRTPTFAQEQFSPRKLSPSNRTVSIPVPPTHINEARRGTRRAETLRVMTEHRSPRSRSSHEPKASSQIRLSAQNEASNHATVRPLAATSMSEGHGLAGPVPSDSTSRHIPRPKSTGQLNNDQTDHTTLLMGHLGTANASWFSLLETRTHSFVYGPNRERWPKAKPGQLFTPVRIAILDSGVSLDGNMASYKSRVRKKMDFTQSPPERPKFQEHLQPLQRQPLVDTCKDENGHGTAVVYQAMVTCPSAEIYVGKVVARREGDSSSDVSRASVARAIIHASKPVKEGGWGVDIINMSFGWVEADLPSWSKPSSSSASTASQLPVDPTISDALAYAESQHVLLFASATNYGLAESTDIFFPARDPRVISVDAEDGQGNPASFARRLVSGSVSDRFCAPGLGAHNPLEPDKPLDGSSFACPVAAGIAGLVLEFARQEPLNHCDSVKRALMSAKGMKKVLQEMSVQGVGHESFKILYPWNCFDGSSNASHDAEKGVGAVGKTTEEARMGEVVRRIIKALEREFGIGKVGFEIEMELQWRLKGKVGA
ncbi:peptidase S8/S53 domain-containing protein [Apiosordaria backusii]|uniref:Peptidase S8/S53 domain-containing protein n=1 Tax=Apiosordaria backusii TaxID=314023 RepID=A0AA40EFA4_9PEZI|nr:peptidase S8/S53 domain-containing protein [Apiosordaria backusii]